jgi:hypothetical protein
VTEPLDTYDVEAMIRDALVRARSEINAEIRELRDEIRAERAERQDADESLHRVLNSRTEHLA